MKYVNKLLARIAFSIMIVVVLLLPVSLALNQALQIFNTPFAVIDLLQTHVLNSDMLASLTEEAMVNREPADPGDPVDVVINQALKQMDHDTWVQVWDLAAPPELIEEIIGQSFADPFNLGENPDPDPEVGIDLRPIKENVIIEAKPVLELVIGSLPDCTEEQVLQLTATALGVGQEYPACCPPEPIYTFVLELAAVSLPAELDNLPDTIDIGVRFTGGSDEQQLAFNQGIHQTKLAARFGWIGLLLLYGITIPLGGRSARGYFRWAGWPMLMAGVFSGVIAYALKQRVQDITGFISGSLQLNIPDLMLDGIWDVTAEILALLSRPMMVYAGAMMAVGAAGLLMSVVVQKKEQTENPS